MSLRLDDADVQLPQLLRRHFRRRAHQQVFGALVHREQRAETKAFAIGSALGGGTWLSLDVLRDLRLMLRWMRFKRMEKEFAQVVETLGRRSGGIAAE